ncbi:MAG: hydrogenase maturation protease [Candidatus Marinimicrobia bacterium]|nr:hydrogenase maturation protease [Candidatus Neomarinimicrobiota bacterium]
MASQNTMLVAGAGNDLMGDDGAGIYVIDRLEELNPSHIDLRNCGTDLFRLGTASQHYQKVILVDAIRANEPPGSIHWFTPDHIGNYSVSGSVHQLSVMEILSLLPLMNANFRGSEFYIVGIEPGDFTYQQGLSGEVQQSAEKVFQLLSTPGGCQQVLKNCESVDVPQ